MAPLNLMKRDFRIQNLIETIQADCLLVANDKNEYEKPNYDYSGIQHASVGSFATTAKKTNRKEIQYAIYTIIGTIIGVC